jgi:DNA-directed RNA polymerase specialized sigma24 family protein
MIILTENEKKYASRLHKTHRRIFEAIESLPEPTYKSVAAALGCPQGTVKSRLSRARGLMQAMIIQDAAKQVEPAEQV